MREPKLTPAQLVMLRDCGQSHRVAVEHYRPAVRLQELGYLRMVPSRWGSPTWHITDAGRARLAEEQRKAAERNAKGDP